MQSSYLSAYPSFILSGLLSPSSSSPSSSLHSADSYDAPRRGSLPTDSAPSVYSSIGDDASLYYFTLQPKRDKDQYRSFLSLDLAESQPSKRRRQHDEVPDSPCLLPPPSPMTPRSPSSPRALPSPKPAPESSLPNVPRLKEVAAIARKPSSASAATRASATTSTVSTRYRRTRRSKALACLEGRRPPPPPNGNFMSLSEDEDEEDEEEDVDNLSLDDAEADLRSLDLSLTDDQLILLIARLDKDSELPPASPVQTRPRPRSSKSSSSPRSRTAATRGLQSFMDFHNDEDSSRWSWRSFIEVAT
ncbi:hypothetical protein R3P38DRAFT_3209982 [Favolaschia claudopus]|uniref:Uncharacterized protein n=1 Tax=Favolaschia claudopus TaxID=2862362 RepID=A0AAW0AGU2_9AGAR